MRTEKRTLGLGGNKMNIVNATEARSKLYSLIDEAAASHQPVIITGKRANAVLVSEEDWNAISETLYLLSMPGMRESIREGMAQDLKDCDKELDW
jgi:antitoxin YefM